MAATRLPRYQLDDRDDPSGICGLLTEVDVLGINAVSKIPQSLPFGFVLDDFRAVGETAENDVRMLVEVVVPRRVLRPPPQRCDDGHAIAVSRARHSDVAAQYARLASHAALRQ